MSLHNSKPRILLLADTRGWALHTIAGAVKHHLSDKFDFEIMFNSQKPIIDEKRYDLVHVLYAVDTHQSKYLNGKTRIIKSIYGHHWEEMGIDKITYYKKYLIEAHAITVPSLKLLSLMSDMPPVAFLFPEGVDIHVFQAYKRKKEEFTVGWAGNANRQCKRLNWLRQACDGICELKIASGSLSKYEMVEFYNRIDVIACSSEYEGAPRTMLEGMACGTFPVSFKVGIAPELINSDINGILVNDESIEGLRNAIIWCRNNLDYVRSTKHINAELIRATRSWECALQHLPDIYYSVL
ncbi:glycosyltransferase [Patescibacteria group bacterium]|nr:glycosyltransferase [Patescibacteria group bacterium]MBU1123415.1 glycosyltransferase [Patescibacteria group bacterium]MBU1911378.1 glycosyltransferase [Patescibacteria group bacterium]